MQLKNSFKKSKKNNDGVKVEAVNVPDNMICRCKKCNSVIFINEVKAADYICPKCGRYFRMGAKARIKSVVDEGSFESMFEGIETADPLSYPDYPEKLRDLKEKMGLDEAIITGTCTISGIRCAIAAMDGRFLMASMGSVVGEKLTRLVEFATAEKLPLIVFACSGGARMQEGIVSLMQMAKTSAALKRHSNEGNLYVSVLTDPTTGGVTASFAMLGDIILAEPKALIGFAGPRVIEQTIGQKLPTGFQRSEFLLEHGFVDAIVDREKMRDTLGMILKMHSKDLSGAGTIEAEALADDSRISSKASSKVSAKNKGKKLSAWDRVMISRANDRPVGEDYIKALFDDFVEFHGDRYFGDDPAIIGGIAFMKGAPVTVIAQSKGHDTKENLKRNFGMPSPEGYRKALRLVKQAEKFNRPIINFVDTPGAFCGIEAEERGQGEAIARNLYEMSSVATPILSIFIGEGGSGGALAMAVSDQVWMLENSVYSILSPEGYASILWKDAKRAKEAASVMKMTAGDLLEMKIVEKVFPEPVDLNIDNLKQVTDPLAASIEGFLKSRSEEEVSDLLKKRYKRYRNF